jgi:RNA polymerase sigma-70 factor (ECF subfamily)
MRDMEETDALRIQFQQQTMPLLGGLYGHAMHITHNQADAEDLLQDTMLKAYCGFRAFQPGTNLKAWLHKIMMNTYINAYRKQKRRPVLEFTEHASDAAAASAEDIALRAVPDERIQLAMETLPEQFRTAVYYADVEGFRYKQIAAITNTSVGTVMSRLHRGRRQLRIHLGCAGQ